MGIAHRQAAGLRQLRVHVLQTIVAVDQTLELVARAGRVEPGSFSRTWTFNRRSRLIRLPRVTQTKRQ